MKQTKRFGRSFSARWLTVALAPLSLWFLGATASYAQGPGTVGDAVFVDQNGNGVQDDGEPGIARVTIALRRDGGSSSPIAFTGSDSNGGYRFTGLPPGNYLVEVTDTLDTLAGLLPTTTVLRPIQLGMGEINQAVDFGYAHPAAVGGAVFQDTDGNGLRDAGEPWIVGATVALQRSDGAVVTTTVTDVDGIFGFEDLVPGQYNVHVDPTTSDLSGLVATTLEPRSVTLSSGDVDVGVDFGYQRVATVFGHLFEDTNGNGVQDAAEPDLTGVGVVITDSRGGAWAVSTDGQGDYRATVPAGTTVVDVDESTLPAGATQTAGADPTTLDAPPGSATDMGVEGYQPRGTITDHVFEDTNGNGVQDAGEPNLGNVRVVIIDSHGGTQTVNTDANGLCSATVPVGDTRLDIAEDTLPAGYIQSEGTDPTTLTVSAGNTVSDVDAFRPAEGPDGGTGGGTGPTPDLSLAEKGAFAVFEQGLSLLAAVVDRQGCGATTGQYSFGGAANENGSASATLDDLTFVVPENPPLPAPQTNIVDDNRGTKLVTLIPTPGEIDDLYALELAGEFRFSPAGDTLWGSAEFAICILNCGAEFPGKEPYEEHIIKDYLRDSTAVAERLVVDHGLEVITKERYPRVKYRQRSRYRAPDGGLGSVVIEKVSIAPNNGPMCVLRYSAEVDDVGGGVQFDGTITVFPL